VSKYQVELPEDLPVTDGPLDNRHIAIRAMLEEVAEWPTVKEQFPNAADILEVLAASLGRVVFLLDRILEGEYPVDDPAVTDAAIFEVFRQDLWHLAESRRFFAEPGEGQA